MESTAASMVCSVCNAPLHRWEYKRHIKACLVIVLPNFVYPPTSDAATIHFQDQQAAWRRNKAAGHWVPGTDPRSE